MRSAPTLKIWITPLASVAMLEKLALLKIAFCKAPVFSNASALPVSLGTSGCSAAPLAIGTVELTAARSREAIESLSIVQLAQRCAQRLCAGVHRKRRRAGRSTCPGGWAGGWAGGSATVYFT